MIGKLHGKLISQIVEDSNYRIILCIFKNLAIAKRNMSFSTFEN